MRRVVALDPKEWAGLWENEELTGLQCGYIYVIIEKGLVIKTNLAQLLH